MSTLMDALIALHVIAGGVALATFWVPLVVTKGNTVHRRVGVAYVAAMMVAALTTFCVVPLRLVHNPERNPMGVLFLGYVGLMSLTTAFYGVRVLRQKTRTAPHRVVVDHVLPLMLVVATVALGVQSVRVGYVLGMTFVPLGLLVAVPQLRRMRAVPSEKGWWLREHLGAMLISCIATLTAFLVTNANRVLPGEWMLAAWLAPTVVITPLIAVWSRRYRRREA
ncbi:MAG: hypothetical protein AB2A00_02135 [Myxococcota bacterium]